jgi:CRISPR-associated protein Cmr3
MNLALSAIDTWFFRDGTPFDQGGSSQAGVIGAFPPHPPTLTGAIRAALARSRGWNGRDRWSAELTAVLGDGPDHLGALRITGPFVLRDGAPVFVMPRHVVGSVDRDGRWTPVLLMRPGDRVISDLGAQVRLPEPSAAVRPAMRKDALEPARSCWVTVAGLQQILRGSPPDAFHVVAQRALWVNEDRVGIERVPQTHAVAEGALYSTRHVRPASGVSLGVDIDGLPPGWGVPHGLVPLGGESRVAACEPRSHALALDAPGAIGTSAVLIALTPLLLTGDEIRGAAVLRSGIRIVSACMDRPLRIGGWSTLDRAPLALRNAVPPGTALFCELDDPHAWSASIKNGLARVGSATAAGFGLCAIGGASHGNNTP